MKDIFNRMGLSLTDKSFSIMSVLSAISSAKEEMLSPADYMAQNSGDIRLGRIAEVYQGISEKT